VASTTTQYVQTDPEADRRVANALAELIISGSPAPVEVTDMVWRGTALADCRAARSGVRINGVSGALLEEPFPPAVESSCQSHPNQLPIHQSRGRERNGLTSTGLSRSSCRTARGADADV